MIEIITLGDFDIIKDDQSIFETMTSQKRLIRLFKYFLVHNEIKLLAENIIEDLWGNDDFKDPLSMLRTQISRLRNITNVENSSIEAFFTITYINGYYVFKLEDDCVVDFVEFEKQIDKGLMKFKKDIEDDHLRVKNSLLLYKGGFMQEMGSEDWLTPVRSRYARLYIKGISYYVDYLKEKAMYEEIISVCEKAIEIKPYEELIHISFMEALVNLHQKSYALIHYEFFTKNLLNDLGEKPSNTLKDFYRIMKIRDDRYKQNIDLNTIDDKMLNKVDLDRAHLCDLHYFKFLYSFEKTNKNRNLKESIGIGIITLESDGHSELSKEELKVGMQTLQYALFRCLWTGDVFSKWNERQITLLLYGLTEELIASLTEKINKHFDLAKQDEKLNLKIKIKIL